MQKEYRNLATKRLIVIVVVSAVMLTACNIEENYIKNIATSNSKNQYQLMLSALGGKNTIRELAKAQISYKAEGSAYEFQENPEPISELVSRYHYEISATMDANRLHQHWLIDNDYAYEINFNFTEVINYDQGVVLGGPNSFGSYVFGLPTDPMNATKAAARQKTWFLSSPLAIVTELTVKDNFTVVYQGHKIHLELDDETQLPESAETLEFDPMFGDVLYKVKYNNWKPVGETLYPHHVIHMLDGHIIREEFLTDVKFDNVAPSLYEFSGATPNEPDLNKKARGLLLSQYFMRSIMMGFPFDGIDESVVFSDFIDNENKVLRILGVDHYSYALLIDDKVYIFDAALSNTRQKAILKEINLQFPGKDIGGVILSHNHFDHAGGFRGALAQGGNLYIGAGSKDLYEDLLFRPHTLKPNPLSSRDEVSIIAIEDKITLGEGEERVDIYTKAEGHAEELDMLIIYHPGNKMLFVGDLFNSGFGGLQSAFPELAPTIKKRAQYLVDFVDLHSLDVEYVATTHGDVFNDTSYESVEAAASF